ncbi:hypothetical protein [Megalodesulfovibrio gigas]|uniref:Uncharacterized protein n=1 Tax=Megalodesulfovibrio gigas (strain ATCC 19364 / DSM 1382 / NCIMB 9332 / VKM B-1759) TaxID=1121448 RepID=T2GCE7_MEGG1|nr:hypothetical protein [Megalodesulfovibrio gigas]AGW13801.1 hypothetical protein DGI_2030 [Megalodesulfovibrio gigas DSM 1382 = ATCC 19364]
MIPTYPDDCIQTLTNAWWVQTDNKTPTKWRLAWAFVPYVDQLPYQLIPKARTDDREHDRAECEIAPCNVAAPPALPRLPVAALPRHDPKEIFAVYRAKKRPVLIAADLGATVHKQLQTGFPKRSFASSYLCVPYYGVDAGTGKRAGYPPAFTARVKAGEYSQFFWDMLPVPGARESILRLDQMQPVGGHHQSLELTLYSLSEEAGSIMDEWMQWHLTGQIAENGPISLWLDMLAENHLRLGEL